MKPESLLGVWTGTAHHSSGWEMKITLSVLQPVEVGATLGIFDIPLIPCSGALRVIGLRGETLDLRAERLQGECGRVESYSLELLPDGTLLYISTGRDGETRGILSHMD